MNICIANNVVEFDPSSKKFKENLYRGGGVLTLGDSLLICLQSLSLQSLPLQYNYRTPSAQLILIKVSIKG